MSDASAPATPDDTKPCKVCGEAIQKVARVCIHCNNYQDWRSKLTISNTVLSLLVALFSVLTVAIPVILTAATPKNSRLSFSDQGTTAKFITLLVTNSGIRPGTVRYPISLVTTSGKYKNLPIELFISGVPGSAKIIEPGKSVLLELEAGVVGVDKKVEIGRVTQIIDNMLSMGSGVKATCGVYLYKKEFKEDGSMENVPISCYQVNVFVMDLQERMKQSN